MSKQVFKLCCKATELQLKGTLNGGQSFRWQKQTNNGAEEWIGVFKNMVWILQQSEEFLTCQVHQNNENELNVDQLETLLRNYFHLDLINLEEYYEKWSSSDPYFRQAAKEFYGIRILQQDPVENLFSFICSQNNHITRISSMVEKLATFYGSRICELNGIVYYGFPKVEDLADAKVEENLRKNGFGYRAKYIAKAAQEIVKEGGDAWLEKLKCMDYLDAKKCLVGLTGIGPKVADCICLMSLGHLQAIPVDTHMYQIASRLYLPNLPKQKSITDKIYTDIGNHFRKLYGPLAGWAHTILFCADLKQFKTVENVKEEKLTNKRKKK
ncbi:hypothetical protein PPYR_02233 [Photinus pyralis]|uniref:N-glycosylase/DNA lyase n=1 Tax=Photinus pyralis TaxID=7054 RepID=A0A5N4B6U0_PHOPY|nr:N-glycosylase/DNA lyase [Photinus pyralis]KAB0805263.1 hypothetical protein PPYR_02233 [Photinus pyralis]